MYKIKAWRHKSPCDSQEETLEDAVNMAFTMSDSGGAWVESIEKDGRIILDNNDHNVFDWPNIIKSEGWSEDAS